MLAPGGSGAESDGGNERTPEGTVVAAIEEL